MLISVIIVNYNVKYFLGQCLASLYQSTIADDLEIIVVDNDSKDGSEAYITEHFPDVRWMGLDENVGFSKANNMGVKAAKGEHVLILNPDTIVSAKAIEHCRDFLNKDSQVGIIGARMRDGSGQYLPESKRGLPTPMTAFFKFSGLASLFPKSGCLNRYYMGHLPEDEMAEVDILTGAFMYMKRSVYLEVGGFDEDYFMYGEDVDLSYSVQKTGRSIIYLPQAEIIHFKGESTRKSTIDYVKRFYEAMLIFAGKHGQGQFAYRIGIRVAIFLKGGMALLKQGLARMLPAVFDGLILLASFLLVTRLWEHFMKAGSFYPPHVVLQNSLLYLAMLLTVFLFRGKYHRILNQSSYFRTAGIGIVALLVCYSLLPSQIRYSRAVLLIGSTLGTGIIGLISQIRRRWGKNKVDNTERRVAIVGHPQNMDTLLDLLDRREGGTFVGVVSGSEQDLYDSTLGAIKDIDAIVRFHRIDEIIFDQRFIPLRAIMEAMTALDGACSCRLYSDETRSIVASYSSTLRGQTETEDVVFSIATSYGRFIKRLVDVGSGVMMLLTLWLFWSGRRGKEARQHIWAVLSGKKSWIGYLQYDAGGRYLPDIRDGVWSHTAVVDELSNDQKIKLDFIYAREYSVWMDFTAIKRHITHG